MSEKLQALLIQRDEIGKRIGSVQSKLDLLLSQAESSKSKLAAPVIESLDQVDDPEAYVAQKLTNLSDQLSELELKVTEVANSQLIGA